MNLNWIIYGFRIAIGALFIFSGLMKMSDLVLFQETIELFQIFPQFSKAFAILIPAVEVVAGGFLLIGIFRKGAMVTLASLLAVFIIAMWKNLMEGFPIDCGCFGPLEIFSTVSIEKILFNLGLIFALGIVYTKDSAKIEFYDQFKVIVTYSFLLSMLLYIPFSNTSWAYAINTKNITDIDWKTAGHLIEKNGAVLFDARANYVFQHEHIPGALSLPVMEFAKYFRNYDDMAKDKLIIVYCDGKDCSLATRAAHKLIARGYNRVFTVNGGIDAWTKDTEHKN